MSSPYIDPVVQAQTNKESYLITGATGFLGKYLVEALVDQGASVVAMGRNAKIGLTLIEDGADFRPVDLRDKESVIACCKGVDYVIHAGALSSAWGDYKDFYDINVLGTKNIIAGCLAHNVKRLVYISSPSVMSVNAPQISLDETHPLPKTFVSDYSRTKAIAEKHVNEANKNFGLETVIIRPKALYGPGDQAVFPRIIQGLSKGRLPIFGDGDTMTNITHVTDVVQASLLAAKSKKAIGRTYLITGGEDVNLYETINLIAERLGYDKPSKRLPVAKAMRIGRIMEKIWKILPLGGEPVLTEYKASIMAYSQTYDISAAKRDLGYEPKIKWKEGVENFLENLKKEPEVKKELDIPPINLADQPEMKVDVLTAGYTSAPAWSFGMGSSWSRIQIPAMFALFHHPNFGPVVYDTGYSTRFAQATAKMPAKLYGMLTPVSITEDQNAGALVAKQGVDPADVKWLIISHFDPDHIGGLRDFPNARFICSWRAWQEIAGLTGFAALQKRLFPEFLPEDFAARILVLPDPAKPEVGPFAGSLDLFGDKSILLTDISGHAPGQLGAFVKNEDGQTLFFAADACWNSKAIEKADAPKGVHPLIAKDKAKQKQAYRTLTELAASQPEIGIIPSHCPVAMEKYQQ